MTVDARQAPTDIHRLLAERWSPRSFEPAHEIPADVVTRLIEAARWSPSASNSQPWRLLVTHRGTPEHATLLSTLAEFNQAWAKNASALILIAAATATEDGTELPWAIYDTGQAAAHLSIQAHDEGLWTHQMGGFDAGAAGRAFNLPSRIRPLAVMAVGDRASADLLPPGLAKRETAPRTRVPAEQILLAP